MNKLDNLFSADQNFGEELYGRLFFIDRINLVIASSIKHIIALLKNNTGFGQGFSYSDWQNSSRDQSNLEPY